MKKKKIIKALEKRNREQILYFTKKLIVLIKENNELRKKINSLLIEQNTEILKF
jgi:hypothetical protein